MSSTSSPPVSEPSLIVIMGVSGCGKTSVGQSIAAWLGVTFVEGDVLHPPRNVEKMSAGIPLDDADRLPWLDRIGDELRRARLAGQGLVASCSALKKSYRDRLRQAAEGRLRFVFLQGSRETLEERLGGRRGHYMPASLLDTQLAALEDPRDEPGMILVAIDVPLDEIIKAVRERL